MLLLCVEISPFLEDSVLYLFIMAGLNDVNLKRGIGDSYSRLKSKVQTGKGIRFLRFGRTAEPKDVPHLLIGL